MDIFANVVGMLGTAAVVGAYFLLQVDKIDAKGLAFNLINLIGASFLLFSLVIHFNLASFVIELFWIAASLIGLYQYFRRRSKKNR
jgi:hypothetical protein